MGALFECVPNISEGRRVEVVDEVAAAVGQVSGAHLLDRHSDVDHNRSVLTFAGDGGAAAGAAFAVAEASVRLIDLRRHSGVHPRMGAVDVIPFVPLGGATMEGAIGLARALGARVGAELDVPVYLYGAAAEPGRPTALREIRGRGFEAMLAKVDDLAPPDFGPRWPHVSAGAVAIGARSPLIALNVMLNTDSVETARRLARQVRTSSGGLPAVLAMGLLLASVGTAQVSMNLVDYTASSPARVLTEIRRLAAGEGVEVLRAELVGLIPEAALAGLEGDPVLGVPDRGATIEARLTAAGLPSRLG